MEDNSSSQRFGYMEAKLGRKAQLILGMEIMPLTSLSKWAQVEKINGATQPARLLRDRLTESKWFNISIKKLLGKNHIQSWEVLSSGLKEWIFEQLKDKRSRYSYRMCNHDPGMNDLHEILSKRGDQVIGGERCLENFGWSVNCSDFNESLLMWHIATDICYHDEVPKKDGNANNVHPNCKMSSLETEDGWENKRKWETISQVWVGMLTYVANHCGSKEHAQSLTRGGELVTHVCLLMAHVGLSEQCLTN
ncbi:unnamed protein product [Dovyalis caffra]|uniref:DUF4220 domain-containing protein n=1 Tax=Dovyalis caffra TaxID=77055 RepID=A0AAV1S2R3_9ROSI|nr:unnamed protein product [Dovyalis caffra]